LYFGTYLAVKEKGGLSLKKFFKLTKGYVL
jgi:hypothetical protein